MGPQRRGAFGVHAQRRHQGLLHARVASQLLDLYSLLGSQWRTSFDRQMVSFWP